jgi:uncharacterized protein (TIGR02266 family)
MAELKDSRRTGSMPAAIAGGRTSGVYPTADAAQSRPAEQPRDPRVPVVAQVRLRYSSILDFHETQSINISRTGMFIASNQPGAVGSLVDFEFALADGLLLLKGKGEVVRATLTPVRGMGIRFRELDEDSKRCLERIVATNEREGRTPEIPLDFASEARISEARAAVDAPGRSSHPLHGATRVQPGLSVNGHDLQIRLTPLTVGYFTNNPLINIRLGGFVIPIEDEVSLGATFEVAIVDNDGISLFHGRGKVVAKHEHRVGIRLSDVDKTVLTRLQGEVARLSPGGR